MAVVGNARYDKYDPVSGGFRAASAIAWVEADLAKIFAVGLDSSGNVVKGAGNTGIIGVVVLAKAKAIGDIIDVMTSGEITGAAMSDGTTGMTAGTAYYGIPGTGLVSATATANKKIGHTVEATRLVVRMAPTGTGA
jgi:hypothetical protein